jgi:hypothetical protein
MDRIELILSAQSNHVRSDRIDVYRLRQIHNAQPPHKPEAARCRWPLASAAAPCAQPSGAVSGGRSASRAENPVTVTLCRCTVGT